MLIFSGLTPLSSSNYIYFFFYDIRGTKKSLKKTKTEPRARASYPYVIAFLCNCFRLNNFSRRPRRTNRVLLNEKKAV